MDKIKITDTVKIGSYEEVDNLKLSALTKNDQDYETLNGLIVKGYEMKWGKDSNTNGETYDKGAFDRFIDEYFVKGGFNMPVTINHSPALEDLAGRVLIIETNSVGFYFVVYIPKTYVNYHMVRNLLKEGLLQGFSKEGWATDYDFDDNGTMVIKEMVLTNVSIVSTPANGIKFEALKETVTDSLMFRKNADGEKAEEEKKDLFDELFS